MIKRNTTVSINGDKFLINGNITYTKNAGYPNASDKLHGRLMMMKSANCIFDDERYPEWGSNENPYFGTVSWDYPDQRWNPDRNTDEFIAELPNYKKYGLSAIYINLMGNQPTGVAAGHPWINCAYTPKGELKSSYMSRIKRILDVADDLGLVVVVGLFYPIVDRNVMVQDSFEKDNVLLRKCIVNVMHFLVDTGHRNLLIEIGNESNQNCYNHRLLMGENVDKAIKIAKEACEGIFPVSTSMCWFHPLPKNAFESGDFILLHAPHADYKLAGDYIKEVKEKVGFSKPIILKEDMSVFCMAAALENGAGFGLYHQGVNNHFEGFQTIPINWRICTVAKWNYFYQLARLSGSVLPERPEDMKDAPDTKVTGIKDFDVIDDIDSFNVKLEAAPYYSYEYPLFLQRVEYFIDGILVKSKGNINQYNKLDKPADFSLYGEDLKNGMLDFDIRKLNKGEHKLLIIPYYIDQWERTEEAGFKPGFRDRTGKVFEINFILK